MLTPSEFEQAHLRTDDPRAQSGFHGSPERWEAARRAIVEVLDGLLMESVHAWSDHEIEPYGLDFAPGLVELARTRLRQWADRIWLNDAATWAPPFRFDFVHVRIEIGPLDRIRGFGRRLIVSSDGSFRRPDSARLAPLEERLHELGLDVACQIYRRSDEHQVEIAVAWVDG